jgi:hypothetical protein
MQQQYLIEDYKMKTTVYLFIKTDNPDYGIGSTTTTGSQCQ